MKLKSAVMAKLRQANIEVARYSRNELEEARDRRWDMQSFNYKDFQVARGIAAAGHITIEESRFLAELCTRIRQYEDEPLIGTLFGVSTQILIAHKNDRQKLYTVDNYSWNPVGISALAHELATREILKEGVERYRVEIVKQDKNTFYASYHDRRPALFFCDADHSYEATLKDLQWANDVKARVICGHDYDPVRHTGVTRAVDQMGGPTELRGTLFVISAAGV